MCGCEYDDSIIPATAPKHTVFVYMCHLGNNIMNGDINEMLNGMKIDKANGRVVIFYDRSSKNTQLIELVEVCDGIYEHRVLEDYDIDYESNKIETFKFALSEFDRVATTQSRSMVISTHGSGWIGPDMVTDRIPRSLSNELTYTYNPNVRGIADTGGLGKGLNVDDFAEVIPTGVYSYLLFDSCLMGCIEAIYPLRDKFDYIIASPSEVPIDGFPYVEIMKEMFEADPLNLQNALTRICQEYIARYDGDNIQLDGGGCISLYDCSKVEDVVLAVAKVTFDEMLINDIDKMHWFGKTVSPRIFQDLQQYINLSVGDGSELAKSVATALEDMVIYGKTTSSSSFFNCPSDKYSGVSIYTPRSNLPSTNIHYSTLEWSERIYPVYPVQ